MNDAYTLDFAPLMPWPFLLACAAVVVLLTGYGLWRRARGTLLRCLTALLALAALANPVARREERAGLPDIAVVVVDESPSQGIGDRQKQADAAEAALRERLGAIGNLETRFVRAGKPAAESADRDEGTRLYSAWNLALSDLPRHRLAGSILVTDGQIHDMPDVSALQDVASAPVHVLLTGRPDERDRRLVVRNAPTFGMIDQDLTVTLRVDDTAARPNEMARLRFQQEDVGEQTLSVPVGRDVTVPFKLQRAGRSLLEFDVAPVEGELTPHNNRVALSINGVRDRLRVLLVTGEAHAGERVWRNLLKADPNVDLVHFTILRPPDKQDGTPIRELSLIAFPIRELFELKLNEFDLIIFDRYRRRGILPNAYFENIANYVARGGALLEVSGPAYATPLSLYRTPLADIFPGRPTGTVRTEPFLPRLSNTGGRHPVTAGLPGSTGGPDDAPSWSRWFRVINVEAERGHILMETPNAEPLMVLDRIEKGRVAQIYSDHIWLWSRGFEGGGPQAELLRRLAHWLMKEPDLEEEALRAEARGGRLEVERRSLTERREPITVVRPDGSEVPLMLEERGQGLAGGTLPVDTPGIYRVRDGVREAVATVGAVNPREFADPRATPAVLQPLAEASHGGVQWLRDGVPDIRMMEKPTRSSARDAAGRNWLGLYRQNDFVVTGLSLTPLALPLAVLAGLLAAMMLMWRRESR